MPVNDLVLLLSLLLLLLLLFDEQSLWKEKAKRDWAHECPLWASSLTLSQISTLLVNVSQQCGQAITVFEWNDHYNDLWTWYSILYRSISHNRETVSHLGLAYNDAYHKVMYPNKPYIVPIILQLSIKLCFYRIHPSVYLDIVSLPFELPCQKIFPKLYYAKRILHGSIPAASSLVEIKGAETILFKMLVGSVCSPCRH